MSSNQNIQAPINNISIDEWLEQWGTWLDILISSGVANISTEVRHIIRQWSDTADILGFTKQAKMAQKFLQNDIGVEQKAELFYQLIIQQDLLQRLYYADRLQKTYL